MECRPPDCLPNPRQTVRPMAHSSRNKIHITRHRCAPVGKAVLRRRTMQNVRTYAFLLYLNPAFLPSLPRETPTQAPCLGAALLPAPPPLKMQHSVFLSYCTRIASSTVVAASCYATLSFLARPFLFSRWSICY